MSLVLPSRRSFIAGLASLVAAPALVRASSLMPVKALRAEFNDFAGTVAGSLDEKIVFFVGRVFCVTGSQEISFSEPLDLEWAA